MEQNSPLQKLMAPVIEGDADALEQLNLVVVESVKQQFEQLFLPGRCMPGEREPVGAPTSFRTTVRMRPSEDDLMDSGETFIEKRYNQALQDVLVPAEKLVNIQTVVNKIPTLDPAHEWQWDEAGGYRASPVTTTKTAKVPEVIRLAKATEHHAEQAQLIQIDKIAGHWTTVKLSGAISADRKKRLQDRTKQLINSVKFAREEANATVVDNQKVGETIFNYLLK